MEVSISIDKNIPFKKLRKIGIKGEDSKY